MSYEPRRSSTSRPSEDCTGRALWALGVAAQPGARTRGSRMLARADVRARAGGAPRARAARDRADDAGPGELSGRRTRRWGRRPSCSPRWRPRLVRPLPRRRPRRTGAGSSRRSPTTTPCCRSRCCAPTRHRGAPASLRDRDARRSRSSKRSASATDRLALVGNAGWHTRGGEQADADEQPIDAAAFVLAFRGAYLATGDHRYLRRMRESFAWFLGANRLGHLRLRLRHRRLPRRHGGSARST